MDGACWVKDGSLVWQTDTRVYQSFALEIVPSLVYGHLVLRVVDRGLLVIKRLHKSTCTHRQLRMSLSRTWWLPRITLRHKLREFRRLQNTYVAVRRAHL
jgi:hypothetical protein